MNNNRMRVVFVSLIMIFSSLAGCLGDEEIEAIEEATDLLDDGTNSTMDGNNSTVLGVLGSVMVSTYHIGELVKGIAGEHVDMEYMSLDNIPVHDFEPSASDLIRLQNSDVFFYHGLGLEPWVDATLDSLGSDAPTAIQVHTMPDGEATLDYESLLVSNLCETLSEGPYEAVELADEEEHADDVEIHAEFVAHNLSFAEDDHDDHDDHGEEDNHTEDGHDVHAGEEDEHDDHGDGHEGHNHVEAEETIANPAGCPADTMISIFHLEEGEYVLEFDAEHAEDFTMAVLKMLGGHAHHDHGDEHGDEHGTSTVTNMAKKDTAFAMTCLTTPTMTSTMKRTVKQADSSGWKKTTTMTTKAIIVTIQQRIKTRTTPLRQTVKQQVTCGWKKTDMTATMIMTVTKTT